MTDTPFALPAAPATSQARLLKIFLALAFWLAILYTLVYSSWFIVFVSIPAAEGLARLLAAMLNVLGAGASYAGTVVSNADFAVDVTYKCTAIYQTTGLVAGVLAWPVGWRAKISGVLQGGGILAGVNFFRLVSIFFAGVFFPALAPAFHSIFWEGVMVVLTILLWLRWGLATCSDLPVWQPRPPAEKTVRNDQSAAPCEPDAHTK